MSCKKRMVKRDKYYSTHKKNNKKLHIIVIIIIYLQDALLPSPPIFTHYNNIIHYNVFYKTHTQTKDVSGPKLNDTIGQKNNNSRGNEIVFAAAIRFGNARLSITPSLFIHHGM